MEVTKIAIAEAASMVSVVTPVFEREK
jgi:hypothetical protein